MDGFDNKLVFVAQRNCVLRHKYYRAVDRIQVTFTDYASSERFRRARSAEGGPWSCGGYTSRAIMAAATKIEAY